jgi:hypothetical protein
MYLLKPMVGGVCIIMLFGKRLGTYVLAVLCDVFGQAAVSDCLWYGLPSEPEISEYPVGDHGN